MEPTATVTPTQSQPNDVAPKLPDDRVRIVRTPGTCGGKPRIDGHRITVEDVASWHERMGMSPDEIVSAYPSITLSDVHAALAYYFEHRDGIDAEIREGERFVEEMRAKTPPSLLQEEGKMLDQQIEAVFENGVFRPLQPVNLPEHQRVTLLLPVAGELAKNGTSVEGDEPDEEVGYEPLPLQQCKTIRVRLKRIGDFGPPPYPVESDDPEQE